MRDRLQIEITEEQKYRSRIISIIGFAFMAPFGHLVVDPGAFVGKFNVFVIVGYFVFSSILVYIGFIFLETGCDILNRRGTKWNQK
jgi:hypothetical protein